MVSNNASTGCTGLANCRAAWSAGGFLGAEGQEASGGAGCRMIGFTIVISAKSVMRLQPHSPASLRHIKASFHNVSAVQWPRRLEGQRGEGSPPSQPVPLTPALMTTAARRELE